MAPVLEFANITKRYRGLFSQRDVLALDGFSLAVERGEILGFLGPNGAGKTTAIHLAMGFMRPTSGAGRMLGQPFGDAATRRRVGFLAENVALYHRPAGKLVRFYGALNGMRDPELARAVRDVLETLDLTDVRHRNAGKFSRGMLQRIGLAQALVNAPELLVLDEPTSALDPLGRVAVRELLLQTRKRGKTVFVSSHLLSEIELVCDRIAILSHGRLARVEATTELLESSEQFEITARGVAATSFPDATEDNGALQICVTRAEQRAVIQRIWELGGEVLRVQPVRRSLEEIFLELTALDSRPEGRESEPDP